MREAFWIAVFVIVFFGLVISFARWTADQMFGKGE